ncbi:MAG: MBL fold metallo-hydrolase [Cyclobacteriaceae bacterium]
MKYLVLAVILAASAFAATAQPIETIQVQDNLYMVGDRTYSLFYITDSGVVVIDPLDSAHAAATYAAIREVTAKPVTHLFYSHNHWDHISGGRLFTRIISHQQAYEDTTPHPEVIMPDSTWQGGSAVFRAGGKEIELYYYGYNHGSGMTVFRFPEHNTVFIIDLVVPDRVLYAYLPDASPKAWVRTLQEIQKLSFDQVLMSHVRAVGDRSDVVLMQDYFTDLYAAVDEAMRSDTPFFDTPYRKTASVQPPEKLR